MNLLEFTTEKNKAKKIISETTDDLIKSEWAYYIHGISYLYLGTEYSSKDLHELRLSFVDSMEVKYRIRGVGYKNGFEFDKNKGNVHDLESKKKGKMKTRLPTLRVFSYISDTLISIADRKGKRLPTIRREAYEEYIKKNLS